MKTPLSIASLAHIRALKKLTTSSEPRIAQAASLMMISALALRDAVKRSEHPDVFEGRLQILVKIAKRPSN